MARCVIGNPYFLFNPIIHKHGPAFTLTILKRVLSIKPSCLHRILTDVSSLLLENLDSSESAIDVIEILVRLLKAYPTHYEQFITEQMSLLVESGEKMIMTSDELPEKNQRVVTLLRCITYSESALVDR